MDCFAQKKGKIRVGVVGFQHETNSFVAGHAELPDFEGTDAWPGLTVGSEIIPALSGKNIPTAGFIDYVKTTDWEIVPLLWCSAAPSGPVSENAFEVIYHKIERLLKNAGHLDGLYLDLHGAMIAEHIDDAEGEILKRLRQKLGEHIPIICSLDFHANISPLMIKLSTFLLPYKTYPHVDMAETGFKAGVILNKVFSGLNPHYSYQRMTYLMPMVWQYTGAPIMMEVYHKIRQWEEHEAIEIISFTPGFPLADTVDTGPMVIIYGYDQEICHEACEDIANFIEERKSGFSGELYSPSDAVQHAIEQSSIDTLPIIIADTQDNPGCGGTSDTVGVLKELLDQKANNAVLGLLHDPEAAALAHQIGEGVSHIFSLGAHSVGTVEKSIVGEFYIEKLGAGKIIGTGPFYKGCTMDLGLMVCLKKDGVRIIVSSMRQQAADRAMFTHVGINLEEHQIIVLKSSVHFRADFESISSEILITESLGENTADLRKITYKKCCLIK